MLAAVLQRGYKERNSQRKQDNLMSAFLEQGACTNTTPRQNTYKGIAADEYQVKATKADTRSDTCKRKVKDESKIARCYAS